MQHKKQGLLFLISSLLLFFFIFPVRSYAQSASSAQDAHYLLNVNKLSVKPGDVLDVSIFLVSPVQPVNAVEAILTYPKEKLSFYSLDTAKSLFAIAAEGSQKEGSVTIARGSIKPVISARGLVAHALFRVKSELVTNELTISPLSAIVRSTDNKNIMTGSVFGQVPASAAFPNAMVTTTQLPQGTQQNSRLFSVIDFFIGVFNRIGSGIHSVTAHFLP